jgi:hypothetical protein
MAVLFLAHGVAEPATHAPHALEEGARRSLRALSILTPPYDEAL